MMELVSIVAGIICGILAGVIVSLLLLKWMSGFEEKRNNRPQIDAQQNLQLWHAGQEATHQFTIVERQMLEDGKRR